jgi:hypothetical protein
MSIVCEGIDRVQAFLLPDGVAADGARASVSGTALVTWRSTLEGMLHQVYVDHRYAGTTLDLRQRHLVVHAPASFTSAVHVEVVAVEPGDAYTDFASELADGAGAARVNLRLLRCQTLPAGATANVYWDNGTGTIDYSLPLNAAPIAIWPAWQDKAGFGMARWGRGDFGYDAAASVGFGKGSFGNGQFGLDADVLEWTSPELPLGRYRFAVKIADPCGNESAPVETEPITVIPAATPAAGVDLGSYDASTGQLTLCISDSE